MVHTLIKSRWFALLNVALVISSVIWLFIQPESGLWALVLPCLFWLSRVVVTRTFNLRPWVSVGLVLFVLTAAVGSQVAYNETAAWNKFCLIIAAVLMYIVIVAQPVENLKLLAGSLFVCGTALAIYFLLTFDFSSYTVKFPWVHRLGTRWMMARPSLPPLPFIHPNDVAGLCIISAIYGLPFLRKPHGNRSVGYILQFLVAAAYGIVGFTVLLCSSRGALLALTGAAIMGLVAWVLPKLRLPMREPIVSLFPFMVIAGILLLEVIVLTIPSGFLGSGFSLNGNVFVSRAEVFRSGLMLARDFPFTGGGLASFPGLYSQYILVIPFYSLPHSHNMILNVTLEQGVLGGLSFLVIYLLSARQLLTRMLASTTSKLWFFIACVSLFTAIFHGMVDDYLYETSGPVFVLLPAAMAVLVSRLGDNDLEDVRVRQRILSAPVLWSVGVLSVAVLLAFFWKPLAAQWYANWGALKMAKIELAGYPANQWSEDTDGSRWSSVELDFQRALEYDADNQTANHRLGLLAATARNFELAAGYLQKAYDVNPSHRGIIKNLGYSYVWLGQADEAQPLLARIPETKYELDVYVWWWGNQKRDDLAAYALQMSGSLNVQP